MKIFSHNKITFSFTVFFILIISMLSVQPVISQTELTEEGKNEFTKGSI
ncbi:MAG: hypothetical protein ACW981_21380 [Candidatus Hodarchaeales archaeon]